ncbi:MAG: BamA/TamA family outer membrane protein, partial [Draconibacterium sp.]|nr:BamA/TamA family outer membrane protein [Draconibacterium sp.]
ERRENLEKMAREHYLLLAKKVSVVGTNEDEIFEVKRINDTETELTVTELSNKKHNRKEKLYNRVFRSDETEEIRLYGLKGDDVFQLDGEVDDGIKIRIIGGKGKDSVLNNSVVKKAGKQTLVYDLKKNTTLLADKDTKNKLSENKDINKYDRLGFRYNLGSPGLFLGYNVDDGVFLGGGPVFNQYLFRRHNKYAILANYAALTNAYNFKFDFDSEAEIKGIDHHFGINYQAPGFALNYFGMGNNTTKADEPKTYFRVITGLFEFDYALGFRFGETAYEETLDGSVNESKISAGLFLRSWDMNDNSDKFAGTLNSTDLRALDLESQLFTGLYISYNYSNLDKATNANRGIQLAVDGRQYFDLNDNYDPFFKLSAEFRAYLSFTRNPRTVLAFRLGGESILGDNYSFLEAAKLGGKTNLRGYWADRFHGDHFLYQNTELRYKMFDFNSYLLNGELGILGFYDSGRVWHNVDTSGEWHHGYGGGVWMSPFQMTILTVGYNISKENKMIQVTMNFKF